MQTHTAGTLMKVTKLIEQLPTPSQVSRWLWGSADAAARAGGWRWACWYWSLRAVRVVLKGADVVQAQRQPKPAKRFVQRSRCPGPVGIPHDCSGCRMLGAPGCNGGRGTVFEVEVQ